MTATIETVDVLDGAWATRVHRAGSGPALVFLAPEEHAGWSPVLDELARSFTVHVPELAGTEEALDELDGLPDLLVYVLDVLDALGLDRVTLVGESFGGMVAAELAAVAGPRVERLVLVAPLGLWRDDLPIPDLYAASPATLAGRLFGDASSEVAQEWLAGLADKARAFGRMRSMRAALHFVFPLPDLGLARRLHRIAAPTLLVWGGADGVVDPAYAKSFADAIASATVELIDGGGHLLSLDRPGEVAAAIRSFAG